MASGEPPGVSIHNLSYRYPGNASDTLHDLSIEIAPGEIFALLGPSGAGKSTTVHVLLGLLGAFTGAITIDGVSMNEPPPSIYNTIGVSFETPRFYPRLTARQNLALFASLYETPTIPANELLSRFGLADDIDTPVGSFSKGMQMRLSFCRAIMHQPGFLVLDEPTSGLDPGNAAVAKQAIRDLNESGTTILLTTHNMEVADQLSDRVAFVVDGRVATIDEPRNLKLTHGTRTVQIRTKSGETHVHPLPGLGVNDAFLSLLRTDSVETIHTQEVSLEEVFLRVTGQGLV